MPKLHNEQRLAAPIDKVFEFHSDPYNLLKITPENLNLVVTNKQPIIMAQGAEITYRIKWLGLPLKWRTLITEYDPPNRFVDIQASGPFKKWHHTHTFQTDGDRTLVVDDVDYELPFGFLGRIVAGRIVGKQLSNIFSHRDQALSDALDGKESD